MTEAPSDESPQDSAFRAEARAFLAAHAKPRDTATDVATTLGRSTSTDSEAEHVQECRDWQGTLADNGWAGVAWPKEYGGRGATPGQARIFAQEGKQLRRQLGRVRRRPSGWSGRRSSPTAPTSRRSTTSRGCCTASRSGASSSPSRAPAPTSRGSRTRADARRRRVGRQRPEGVDVRRALQRLGHPPRPHRLRRAEAPRHHLLPRRHARRPASRSGRCARSPAYAHFNEVFLTDVRIPAANLLGPLERRLGRHADHAGERARHDRRRDVRRHVRRGAQLAQDCGRTDDPVIRQELARSYTRFEILKWLGQRARAAAKAGQGRPAPRRR